MPYTFISHTADIGFRVWGKTLRELFQDAAKAVVASMMEVGRETPKEEVSIELKASSLEELLVKWLEETLFLFETKNFVGLVFKIESCKPKNFRATIVGVDWDEKKQTLKTQIKAVTYHGLEIQKTEKGYEAQVILDV